MKSRSAVRVLFQRKILLRLLIISIAFLIFCFLICVQSKATPVALSSEVRRVTDRKFIRRPTNGNCVMLDWTAGHGLDPWVSGDCSSCHITTNRSYLPDISDFDAIVFYHWWVTDFPPIETRRPEQLYIMNYLESPQRSLFLNLSQNSHYFNLTMAYRLDSDIVSPYGRVLDKTLNNARVAPAKDVSWRQVNKNFYPNPELVANVKNKKKLVSWVVSNCDDDPSERMAVVKSMQKFIIVDIYGKCGQKCDKCKPQLALEYFFYLAFENSLATDYVSEKTYSMLGKGIIPVVYGGSDYNRFLPPKSYINVQDFNTTQDLAEFLKDLSQNTTEYLSYFWFTDFYNIEEGISYDDFCSGVQAARRNIGKKVQYYPDLKKWEHEGTWKDRRIRLS